MRDKLKACPFCGGGAKARKLSDDFPDGSNCWHVGCENDECWGAWSSSQCCVGANAKQELIGAWNKRSGGSERKYLKDLTVILAKCLDAMDKEMEKPSSHGRGKRIALICNTLNMANDIAWHNGLGLSLKRKRY